MPISTYDWSWLSGRQFITGADSPFNPDYYTGQSRDDGFDTGDMLRIDGESMAITMTSWDTGVVFDRTQRSMIRIDFDGFEQVYGSDGRDIFRAGKVTEALDGWRGVTWFGGGGDDDFVASRFNDFVDPGDGDDVVRMGAGDDHVDASRGDDTVYGGPGNDNIRWGGGESSWLAPGDDYFTGGDGRDTANLWAHYGDVGVTVNIGVVRTDGAMSGTGTVQVDADGNTDTVRFRGFEHGWTHEGNDTIDASGATTRGGIGILWGARWGNDVLIGSNGNDTMEGGPGSDTLTGGAGDDLIAANGDWYQLDAVSDGNADTIVFRAGDGHDTVTGFDIGIDVLDIIGATVSETEDGTLYTLDTGDSVLIYGVFDFV